jgi:hypothetical protein
MKKSNTVPRVSLQLIASFRWYSSISNYSTAWHEDTWHADLGNVLHVLVSDCMLQVLGSVLVTSRTSLTSSHATAVVCQVKAEALYLVEESSVFTRDC